MIIWQAMAEICHHALPPDDTCHFSNHMWKPRGSWATSLTWEASTNQILHLRKALIIPWHWGEKLLSPFWEINGPFIYKNPFTQGCFVTTLVKIAPVILEKCFFNFVKVFSLFCYYLPLEKGVALHLNKFESLSPKDALLQVLLKLAQWFWRKCEKFTDRQTDDGQQAIRKLSWANNVRKQPCVGVPYLLPSMQCAAVRTMSGSMRVPPQTSSPDARIPACQGQAEGSASVPPMIRRLGSCTALPDPPSKPL